MLCLLPFSIESTFLHEMLKRSAIRGSNTSFCLHLSELENLGIIELALNFVR